MTVLVVEDDENKEGQLEEFVLARVPEAVIERARSYQSGLRLAVALRPELILLDMSMPTYDISTSETGGRPKAFAGREILRELKRRGIPSPVIVVTQFERFGDGQESTTLKELKVALKESRIANYVGTVYYHPAESLWREELGRLIGRVLGGGGGGR